jgi:hypothetical protein
VTSLSQWCSWICHHWKSYYNLFSTYFLYSYASGLTFKQAQTRSIIAVCGNTAIIYFEAFFLTERMIVSDSLHKLRISHRMSFSHYKQNTCVSQFKWLQGREILPRLVLKIRTIFLTAALSKTEATPRSTEQLPQQGMNVYSILPCLREMNRHFVYISIDTAYNRFP